MNAAPWMSRNIRVRGTTQRRRDHLAARVPPWRVATCKRYGHEMRSTIRRDNPRKQLCAAALTVRGTIANNDVNEAATNETPRVAAVHKKIIYACNGRHGRYTYTYEWLSVTASGVFRNWRRDGHIKGVLGTEVP